MTLPVYVEWNWWLRWFMVLNITDEGTYAEDQVPDDYGGPVLQVEQNIILFMVTDSGYMQRLYASMGLNKIMDKERKIGIGLDIEPFEDLVEYVMVDVTGPSTFFAIGHFEERSDAVISDSNKQIYRELLRATIANA